MRHVAIAGLCALALAGCQTTNPSTTTDTKAVPPAPVDAKIHAVSAELAGYCGTAKALLPIVGAFVGNKPAVTRVLASGDAAVARFCENPPDDVNAAITVMAKVATDLVIIWRKTP